MMNGTRTLVNTVFFRQQLSSYFTNQARQGKFWWLWMIVLPVVPLVAYMFLGFVKILPDTDGIPRPVYIVIGMTCWLMFYDGVTAPFRAIDRSAPYFLRKEISLLTLLSSWLPERLVASLIQIVFCITLVSIQMSTSLLNALAFILLYVLGSSFFICFGHLLSIVGMISPSSINFADVTNRFLLFLSGVIFPLPSSGAGGIIQYVNPYYVFIENARRILLDRDVDWMPMGIWLMVGIMVAVFLRMQLPKLETDVRDFLQ